MIGLQVYRDVAATNFEATITSLARDTWQRTALGVLGDDQATCKLVADKAMLRAAFDSWLGYWVREYEAGLLECPAFTGQIFSMRLYLHGRIYLVSLADVFNEVVVAYVTTSGGAKSYVTDSDAASVARYGSRALIIDLDAPTTLTTANNKAADVVAELGTPRPRLVGFYDEMAGDALEMTVLGSGHLLEAAYLHDPSAVGNESLDEAVSRVAGEMGGLFDAGVVGVNTRGYLVKAISYTSLWDRLADVLDAGAPSWRLGCYGTPALDYYQLDADDPMYRIDFHERGRVFYDRMGRVIPEALVKPGQYARVPDVEMDLPTTILIDGLTFSEAGGVQFSPELEDRLALIAFELGVKV